MSVPQATINDLLNTHDAAQSGQVTPGSAPNGDPISNFIQTLAKYALETKKNLTGMASDAVNSNPLTKGFVEGQQPDTTGGYHPGGVYAPGLEGVGQFLNTAGMAQIGGGIPEAPPIGPAIQDVKNTLSTTMADPQLARAGSTNLFSMPSAQGATDLSKLLPENTPVDPVNTPMGKYARDVDGSLKPEPAKPIESAPEPLPGGTPTGVPPIKQSIPNESVPPNQSIPTKPFPEVPDQPALVTDRVGTHPVTGGNPVRLDFSNQAGKNSYYLADQTHAQDVLNKYVPGDNALEVQKNLPIQLQEESQRIKNMMATNPNVTANVGDLVNTNEQALKKAGYTPGVSTKADTATREALNEFDSSISSHAGEPGKDVVTGDDLLNYKNILDDKLQSAYKKMDNATALTPGETAMRTLRTTINDKLKQMYPDMGPALDRQSGMLDAQPYVAKAASSEMGEQLKAANAAKAAADAQAAADAAKPKGLGAIGNAISSNPRLAIGGLTALTTGGVLGKAYLDGRQSPTTASSSAQINSNGNTSSTNTNANIIIGNNYATDPSKIQENADHTIDVPDYLNIKDDKGNSVFVSDQALKTQHTVISNAYNEARATGNQVAMDQAVQDAQNLKNAYDASQPQNKIYTNTVAALGKINNAITSLSDKNSPIWADALSLKIPFNGPDLEGKGEHKMINPDYSAQMGKMQAAEDAAKALGVTIPVTDALSQSSALQKLQDSAKALVAQLNQKISSSGSSFQSKTETVSPKPTTTNRNIPAKNNTPTSLTPATSTGLPSITNGSYQFTDPHPGWGQ